jgi:phosphatidate cytidylyltransferase
MTQPADVTAQPAPEPPPGEPGRGPAGTPPPAPQPKVSRTGRNLPVAVGVGAALGALILVTIYRFPPGFVAVLVVAFGVAVAELVTQLMVAGARPPRLPLLAGTAAIVVCAYLGGIAGLAVAYAATVLATVFWRLPHATSGTVRDVSSAVWIATYVPFLGGFAALMFAQTQGADRIVVFIAATVCSDVGGYAAGVLFGRHPLAPRISPAKTWEGFAGSVVACSTIGILLLTLTFHEALWKGLLFGLAIVVTATLGDLGESMIKRDLGIKDMGALLPGHGGVMDRLDSLLPCAAVAYLLLSAFAPV